MATLPLFPLGTVLVPGARLPLRIFEPRYVEMLRSLVEERESPEFGVVAIRAGHEVGADNVGAIFGVGCTALLTHVERMADGTYTVLARGARRFTVDAVDTRAQPYLVGEVTWIPEDDGDVGRCVGLARVLRARLVAYSMLFEGGSDAAADEHGDQRDPVSGSRPTDLRALSYRVGELVALAITDRQALLEAPTTEDRLALARRLVRREIVIVDSLGALPHTVAPDTFSAN